MDGIYTMASPSSSSLYGNVGCAIRQLILSKFPYNYFNYINVSTELAFKNMRRQFGANTNTEISKRKKPYLIIQPTYQPQDQDAFLQNIPLTKNDMDIQVYVDGRYLFEVIKDKTNNWALKFKLNRDRIEYDVNITVSTLHQQLDIYKAMMNQITWERALYETAALEAVIPKTMVQHISNLCGMNIEEYPELIPAFLRHLNSISGYPITYKVRNASATDEFYMYYQHNLVVVFSDLQLDSANKKGMVDESYSISFRVSVEFNLPGLFILDGSTSNMNKLLGDIVVKNSSGYGYDMDKDDFVPLFSLSNFYNKFPQKRDGLTLYGSFLFTTDVKDPEDSADIGLLIEPEHQKAIRFHTTYGMIDSTICKVYVIKNAEELTSDDFKVNWDTMKIEYKRPDPDATYRVAIYMNMEVINADLANPRINGPFDKYALKDNIIDYGPTTNKIHLNLDEPKISDSDFDVILPTGDEVSVPATFRAEEVTPERVPDRREVIIATPTSRDHPDAWHNMDTIPDDFRFNENVSSVPSDHRSEESFHYMAQESKDLSIYPEVEGIMGTIHTEHGFVGEINLEGLSIDSITPVRATTSMPSEIEEPTIKKSEEEKDEHIMKYYSSIFDQTVSLVAEVAPTPKKYKWSSSTENQKEEVKYIFKDKIEEPNSDAMDTWSKIISTALLYNYATKIAIEDANNYSVDLLGEKHEDPLIPSTDRLCDN